MDDFITLIANADGETWLRIRQATTLGYAICCVGGVCDLQFATSKNRRARTIDNGKICGTLTANGYHCRFVEL